MGYNRRFIVYKPSVWCVHFNELTDMSIKMRVIIFLIPTICSHYKNGKYQKGCLKSIMLPILRNSLLQFNVCIYNLSKGILSTFIDIYLGLYQRYNFI